ncbi:putative glycosyltransferase [Pectobacterium carotovorum subsp. carotovorum]|nr:putative glycosyltransferase [Pectobacterium carotovorum subsp. carotovorum]
MKNICFLIASISNPGGTERMALLIASKLAESGLNVAILSICNGDIPFFYVDDRVTLASLYEEEKSLTLNFLPITMKIRAYLKNNNINVIVDVDTMLSLFSIPALLGLNVKHISWEHFNFFANSDNFKRRLSRRCAALFSDTVVTLTERDRKFWLDNTRCRAEIISINNPSPFEYDKVNCDFSYDLNSKIVLSIGRLTYQKGFDLLIEAWKKIQHHSNGWKLYIVGDGEDEKKLKELITDYQLYDSVNFFESTNDISSYYEAASIYCMSSRYEGLPMVLIEACFHGLPIVSFDCDTGPSEVVLNCHTGLLCKNGDISSLANGLTRMINNSEERYEFSKNAYEQSKKFNINKILGEWLKLIG